MHERDDFFVASDLFAEGVTTVNGYWGNVIKIAGDISSVTIDYVLGGQTVTFSNEEIVKAPVKNHNNLYLLDKITFTATGSNGDTAVTYSYFLVPYEVTAERTISMDGPLGVLVGVIPLLMVAGLVTGAVVWFINRKG